MGQAKNRGTLINRISQAKMKIEQIKPEKITCNGCGNSIEKIMVLDTTGIVGIDGAFAGLCLKCNQHTLAVKGEFIPSSKFLQAYNEFTGGDGVLGVQTSKGERLLK